MGVQGNFREARKAVWVMSSTLRLRDSGNFPSIIQTRKFANEKNAERVVSCNH